MLRMSIPAKKWKHPEKRRKTTYWNRKNTKHQAVSWRGNAPGGPAQSQTFESPPVQVYRLQFRKWTSVSTPLPPALSNQAARL